MKPEVVAGIAGIALSALAWFVSGRFPAFEIQNAGPAFFPRVLAVCFTILSAFLIVQGRGKEGEKIEKIARENIVQIIIVFCALIVYYVALDTIGYFVSTFIFSGGVVLAVKKEFTPKAIGMVLFYSTLVCSAIYIVFRILLKTSFPSGILF